MNFQICLSLLTIMAVVAKVPEKDLVFYTGLSIVAGRVQDYIIDHWISVCAEDVDIRTTIPISCEMASSDLANLVSNF
jgi:hypothetical protein